MANYLDELNEGQRAAVLYNDGPSLVMLEPDRERHAC